MADQHRIDRALALLKSLASHCDNGGDDHAWRTCRRCLASEEIERPYARADLAAFLADYAAVRAQQARTCETCRHASGLRMLQCGEVCNGAGDGLYCADVKFCGLWEPKQEA